MTQKESAELEIVTPAMKRVAEREGMDPELIRAEVAAGRLVIPANHVHLAGKLDPIGIGRAVRTKINANIGTSPVLSSPAAELRKMEIAVGYGADAVMDLSTGGNLDECRIALIEHATVTVGTVPIYQMAADKPAEELTHNDFLREIRKQAEQGVDFMTLHAGILRDHLPLVEKRLGGIVSRGGALLARWMLHHRRQNPLYELFDEICEIAHEYDVTFSLGDGLRPGCLADATDEAQIAELHTLGELTERAWSRHCQVMVEGPGHIPFDQIERNMTMQAEMCKDAPFYVLGPVVTDVAPGYDHITSAIGATAAAFYGASFLCYVTPREHLGLPEEEDVRQGVIASRIAAHAADVARGFAGARKWDDDLSRARTALNWSRQFELAMDPERARELHGEAVALDEQFCSMCGAEWCAVRASQQMKPKARAPEEQTEPPGSGEARPAEETHPAASRQGGA